MVHIHYRITQHDGGWAYTFDNVYSEPFPTRIAALQAARRAAAEQRVPGESRLIEFQDEQGKWHVERSEAGDRPEADVQE